MTTVAVVPVKQLENAKQRLGGLLSAAQRQQLFRAMFEDVLEAATTCDRIDRVIVVTDDDRVADIGMGFGAGIRSEPSPGGLIEAVTMMASDLAAEGVTTMVFLPADVPLVSVEELEVALDGFGRSGGRECLIVPSHDLGGTNAMVCSPPDAMTFAFGEDSFRRHLKLARAQDVEPVVARLPGIGLDIDTPDDLRECARRIDADGLGTNLARLLAETGIMNELKDSADQAEA
ncbi:MAG: 2-phospho-L-lactate guanylyltransferase [Gammaproteobacteria bacterium]|nr:2-phospho-L-lactate guanylyltransferase [Gammaproteobacteria bacterium]